MLLLSQASTSSLNVEELLLSPSNHLPDEAASTQTPSNKEIATTLPSAYSTEELDVLCDQLSNLSEEEASRLKTHSKASVFSIDTLKMMSGHLGLPKNRKKEELIKQIRQRKSNQKVVRIIMEMQSKAPEHTNKTNSVDDRATTNHQDSMAKHSTPTSLALQSTDNDHRKEPKKISWAELRCHSLFAQASGLRQLNANAPLKICRLSSSERRTSWSARSGRCAWGFSWTTEDSL